MDELFKLSSNTMFTIRVDHFLIKMKEVMDLKHDGVIEFDYLCYIPDENYDNVKFTSNQEEVSEFINDMYGYDNAEGIVKDVYGIGENYNINVYETFLENYSDLFFEIHVINKGGC